MLQMGIFLFKKTGEVQIHLCDDIAKPLIATLHNILFAPDLRDRLFSIIMFMNLGHTCLFHEGFSQFSSVIMNRMQ